MNRTLVSQISSLVTARHNCEQSSNHEWHIKHTKTILTLVQQLPSGSGWDNGTRIDLARSTPEHLVFYGSFHHMNDGGYYDGWTDEYEIHVRPSLAFGIDLKITGRNRNEIKENN